MRGYTKGIRNVRGSRFLELRGLEVNPGLLNEGEKYKKGVS